MRRGVTERFWFIPKSNHNTPKNSNMSSEMDVRERDSLGMRAKKVWGVKKIAEVRNR